MNLKEEAKKYFTKHYPRASADEIDKQVEDWQNKVDSGKDLVKFFEDRVGSVSGKKILDIGFGSGGIAIAFNLSGAQMSATDIDPELKDIAERNAEANHAKVDFRLDDGVKLPYTDNYFDAVTSFSVLEHVSFPQEIINEMLRVLKPGGRILLTLPNKYSVKETHTLAYFVSYMPHNMANAYLKMLGRSPLEDDNLHFYSYFGIMKMLKRSGYKYELVYKNLDKTSGLKKFLIRTLKRFGIHYTAFLRQLIFIIEKK